MLWRKQTDGMKRNNGVGLTHTGGQRGAKRPMKLEYKGPGKGARGDIREIS